MLHLKSQFTWIFGIIVAIILQYVYELFTYLIDLNVQIYRLLIFRYLIFIYIGIVLYKMQEENKICWKSMIKSLPFGFLYIFLVGYMHWQPEILFRYPTWYRSSAPVIFWVAPIVAYIIGNERTLINRLENNKIGYFISDKVQLLGKASYHIYIVQMLWFGLAISHINTVSWRKVLVCIVSMIICSGIGVAYYYVNHCFGKIFNRGVKNQN